MTSISIDFTSFKNIILENLREALGEEYTVFSHTVRKNNNMRLTGISVRKRGSNTSPTIYIDRMYHEGMSLSDAKKAAEQLCCNFRDAQIKEDIDLSNFMEFEKAAANLAFKLINKERNREYLKTVPHKEFFDLAVVFYYSVQEAPFCGNAAITVQNTHMRQWKTDADELFHIAMENTPKLFPGRIEPVENVVRDIYAQMLEKDLKDSAVELDEEWKRELLDQMTAEEEDTCYNMYVLTNEPKLYGAACMLYSGLLKEFADELKRDIYILPSSVHEVILVPAEEGADKDSFREIVTDINRTQVAADEVLADSVYYYSRSNHRINHLA